MGTGFRTLFGEMEQKSVMLVIGRTRREIGAQTPTTHSDVFARSRSDLLGSRDLGCPRMEEVLRAPAAHGVSSLYIEQY